MDMPNIWDILQGFVTNGSNANGKGSLGIAFREPFVWGMR